MLKFVPLILFVALFCGYSAQVLAVTPSPAMLEQFKQLPKAEQERLAKQYGFDVSLLQQSSSSRNNESTTSAVPLIQKKRDKAQDKETDSKGVKKDEPERFGLRLFDAEISTFAPVSSMPVPDSYVLGADDELLLQLYGKQSSEISLTVSRDGKVLVPDVGPVTVGGLHFAQAVTLITDRVRQASIGVEAAVSMGPLRTINVFVAGEAKYPGAYAVSALTTVTQALFVAGGVSDIGSLREITVNRAGKVVAQFDLYDLLLRGSNKDDVHLQHGDVVFVAPVKALAEVRGEVKRPAIYEVKPGNTLADLLAMAGGSTAGAYPKAAVLERYSSHIRTLKNIDLTDSSYQQLPVQAGDILRIDAASVQAENQIIIAGAAARPGFYAWQHGMKVTDLIRNHWSDLLPTADLDYALIIRETIPGTITDLLHFSPANAISKPGSKDDITLLPRDRILLFHYADYEYERATLNNKLRETIMAKLELNTEQRWLMADLTSNAFEMIRRQEKNISLEEIKDKEAEKIFDQQLSTEEQQKLLTAELRQLFSKVFTDNKMLLLSPHLNRTELLYPVLQQLKRQSRSNKYIETVSVSGAVKVPGDYPLTAGARIADLINAAGGLNDAAYISRAELTRIVKQADNLNGVEVSHKEISLQQVLVDNAEANIALQNRDRLNVFSVPSWTTQREITLEGQVRFPGTYIVQQGETLSQVIARAGGLTDNAFVFGSVFTREQIQEKETVQYEKLLEQLKSDVATRALTAQNVQIAPADAMLMIKEIERIKPQGRLVIDLDQAITGNAAFDITVEHGDKLHVPRINRAISVVGEVQHAGTHRFDPTLSIRQYLNLAGGIRKRADEERTYIIRADGSVMVPSNNWFAVSSNELKPGDTIIVPLDTEYKDNLSLWAQVTQIFYQSAVAIAALNSF